MCTQVKGERDGESTVSDDSGPERAPDYKPSCMFTHGGPSTEAVEAHRKRQLEDVGELQQPKKKKKQQPITDYLAASTAGPEGAAAEPEGASSGGANVIAGRMDVVTEAKVCGLSGRGNGRL